MDTTLYLVRHGETEGSETKRYKGSIDVPLSEKGIEQIKGSSAFIQTHLEKTVFSKHMSYLKAIHSSGEEASPHPADSRLNAVYCSDLSRAAKSAGIIAEPYGLRPVETPALRERSFGIWEGMTFTEIKEKYPAEFEAWAGNPLQYSPIEGESTLGVRDRILPALTGILDSHKGENIAIIAHGGVNRIILCHFLGIPLENIFRVEQDYAAVNIIEIWDKYPVVKLLNGREG